MLAEVAVLVKLAAPIMACICLANLTNLVDLAMIGHYGKDELTAVAVGVTWSTTAFLPANGAAFSLDPVLAQAFGAKDREAYATWFKAGTIVSSLFLPITVVLIIFTEDILIGLQIDPVLARNAAEYSILLIPGTPFIFGFFLLMRFFHCQLIFWPTIGVAIFANIANLVFNWVLIFRCDMGIQGAAIATSLSRFLMFLGLAALVFLKPEHRAWFPGFRASPTSAQYRQITKLALSAAAMLTLEISSFQFTALLAADLGATVLAAHTIVYNAYSTVYTAISYPFSAAITIRVGNLIGDNKPLEALASAKICLQTVLFCMTCISILMLILRFEIPRLYTNDEAIVDVASGIVVIAALFQVFDGTTYCCLGILRGLARHVIVSVISLIAFWGIAVPLGATLAFQTKLGVYGLWWGMAGGLLFTVLVSAYLAFFYIDWSKEGIVPTYTPRETDDEVAKEKEPLLG